jgi:hypothetical protein
MAARVRTVGPWLCLLSLLESTRGHAAPGLAHKRGLPSRSESGLLLLGNNPVAKQREEAGAGNGDGRVTKIGNKECWRWRGESAEGREITRVPRIARCRHRYAATLGRRQ